MVILLDVRRGCCEERGIYIDRNRTCDMAQMMDLITPNSYRYS